MAMRGASRLLRGRSAWAGVGRLGGVRPFHGSRPALMAHKDFYETLGVDRNVDEKTLKKRFRELAKKYHPDQSKEENATERFQEINHAYEVLSDPEKRRAYDNFGPDFEQAGGDGGMGGGFGGFEDFFRGAGFGGFGGGGGGRGVRVGSDARVGLHLSFLEAVHGCTKTVSYKVQGSCSSCSGSGVKKGEEKKTASCGACHGQGFRLNTIGGVFQVQQPCEQCGGTGQQTLNKCGTCSGTGLEESLENVDLSIPPGVDTGMTLAQRGAGNAPPGGGIRGDLHIELRVSPDPYFRREGLNLHTQVKVSLAQAVLGDKVPVRTLEGEVDLKVPPGVKNGEVRRLRGRGVAELESGGRRGDQFIVFSVDMPTQLTDRQRELIREFDEEERKKKAEAKSAEDAP